MRQLFYTVEVVVVTTMDGQQMVCTPARVVFQTHLSG